MDGRYEVEPRSSPPLVEFYPQPLVQELDLETASPSRRRFLRFCLENPAADECRVYEL